MLGEGFRLPSKRLKFRGFTTQVPNRTLFKSQPASHVEESICHVLGSSLRDSLNSLHIEKEEGVECPFTATLVLSAKSPVSISPALAFVIFVNDRLVQHRGLRQAIRRVLEQFYYCSDTNSKSRNQNLFCYLSISIASCYVDVNVHPSKKEVCFLDEEYVIHRIVASLSSSVSSLVASQPVNTVTPPHRPHVDSSQASESASKKIRVDPTQLSLATPPRVTTPFREPRAELALASIQTLRSEVQKAGQQCHHERELLQSSLFVGCLQDSSRVLLQSGTCLYLLTLPSLL